MMQEMKLKTKLLVVLLVVLAIICLCGTVKATDEEVTDEYVQNILNAIPDSMYLDIPEVEYEKSETLIQEQLDEIFEKNKIDTSKVEILINPVQIYYGMDGFHNATVLINWNVNGYSEYKSKDISIKFNNTDDYNLADEQIVKNLKIEPKGYYVVNYNGNNTSWDEMFNSAEKYYNNLINDETITVKADTGAGDLFFINLMSEEGGTSLALFKNGVLYDIRVVGYEISVPSITIPNNVSDNEINDYILDVITPAYKEYCEGPMLEETFDANKIKITKGAIYKMKTFSHDENGNQIANYKPVSIPDGYTIDYDGIEAYLIAKREEPITITTTDEETNVKLDTTTDIVPAGTELVVSKVTTGNDYNTVVSSLGNEVNNFVTYDIKLLSEGVEVQPTGKVKISLPIPTGYDKNNLVVYRVDENGTKTEYDVTVEENYAVFETDHFSTYVLAEKKVENTNTNTEIPTTNTNDNELDETPKTGVETNGTIALVLTSILSLAGAVTLKRF